MPKYRVTLQSSEQAPVVTHDGYFGRRVTFQIQRLADRRSFTYQGKGGGRVFENRFQILSEVGGVVVEGDDPPTTGDVTNWKEGIVNKALESADKLQ